jgi:uncharacterized membrane protein
MKKKGMFHSIVALSVGALLLAGDAGAAGKDKKKKDAAEPAQVEKVSFDPSGLSFGKTPKAVAEVYDKAIDKEYLAEFEKVEPGAEMKRLEEKVQREKELIRKSYLALDDPPSTLDGTNYEGEFTYNNKEAVMRADRGGKKRVLFFIREKLWKIIDVYPLGEHAKWGADFKAAVAKLEAVTGIEGRPLAAKPEEGRRFEEVDWADEKTHLRAINWGKRLAIAYVDRATEAKLGELRSNKPKKKDELDPSVKGVLR